jgi:hemerythrin-like domain-containing protein
MLRDKNLIPLSRQHHRALALCVRIDRAQPATTADLESWQREIDEIFEQEIEIHFAAEEGVLFPVARQFAELVPLVKELVAEHDSLREAFSRAKSRELSSNNLVAFASQLSAHVRNEERRLFERMQALLTPEQLAVLGARLEVALKDSTQSCAVPSPGTALRARS